MTMDRPQKVEDVTPEKLVQWEKEAVELNGKFGVTTIICHKCGAVVMSNYVPLRIAWWLLDKGQ